MKHQIRLGVNTPEVEIEQVEIPPGDKPRDWRWYLYEAQGRAVLDAEIENALSDWVSADTRRHDAATWLFEAKRDRDGRRVQLDKDLPDADRPEGRSAAERAQRLEMLFQGDKPYAAALASVADAEVELQQADHELAKAEFILKELRKSEASKDTRLRFLMGIGKIPMRHVSDEILEEIGFAAQEAKAKDVAQKSATDAWVTFATAELDWESIGAAQWLKSLPDDVDVSDARVIGILNGIRALQPQPEDVVVL